jgi:alpha-beta hydrolase superfamily lysophospholipase
MLTTADGLQLFTQNYLITNPKANVLIVHGLGEHCLRYAHVAKALNDAGASVYTFDLRGHGQSEGEQAYIKNMDDYLMDVEAACQAVPKSLPFFIVGHSMGGQITLNFLLQKKRTDIRGVVLSGAGLEAGKDITAFTIFVVKLIAKIAPRFKTVKLDVKSISRDATEVEKYSTDPLIYRDGTKAGLGLALLNGIKALKPKFNQFDYPTLIMHGESDKIANIDGSKQLYAQSPSQDKTLKIWEGAYHEIFNETNRQEVIKTMTDWIEARI